MFSALSGAWFALLVMAAPQVASAQTVYPDGTYDYSTVPNQCSDSRDASACIPNAVGFGGDATGTATSSSARAPRCGDGICNGTESSSTCSVDCPSPSAGCGTAATTTVTSYPTAGAACSAGLQAANDSAGTDGTYNWTCTGGGVTAACFANRRSNGACGAANAANSTTFPTGSNACAEGNVVAVDSTAADGTYNWTCNGLNGGTNSTCQANRVSNGGCGTANGTTVATYPTAASACAAGTQDDVDDTAADGTYNWSCVGGSGGSSATCSATKAVAAAVNGTCGSANGTNEPIHPSGAAACSAGVYSNTPDSTTNWFWSCFGSGGGTTASCSANRPIDGVCGPSEGTTTTSQPTGANACSTGTFVDESDNPGAWNWTCRGASGGLDQSCESVADSAAVDGVCGTSANNVTDSYPTAGFCSSGSVVAVDTAAADGSFNWTCEGQAAGASAQCSAPKRVPLCGSAQGTTTSTQPSGTAACTSGSPVNYKDTPNWSWNCRNGNQFDSCSASRPSTNGVCGTGNATTVNQQPSGTDACVSGTFSDTADSNGIWRWSCQGTGAGSSASCSATQGASAASFIPDKVSMGDSSTCAKTVNGLVRCWGKGQSGNTGNGMTNFVEAKPVAVTGLTDVVQISGSTNTCALTSAGRVFCWGFGFLGANADGTTNDLLTATEVTSLAGVQRLSGAYYGHCALMLDQSLRCWGSASTSGNAAEAPTPVTVSGLTVTEILSRATGSQQVYTRLSDGTMRVWGVGNSETPVVLAAPPNGGPISEAANNCYVSQGKVYCKNAGNNVGQMGLGNTINPAQTWNEVPGLSNVTSIAGGTTSYCATTASKQLYCWGDNAFGQLGVGSPEPFLTSPTLVTGLPAVDEVVGIGFNNYCAYVSQGRNVYCWGNNSNGQIGDGTQVNRYTPVLVTF